MKVLDKKNEVKRLRPKWLLAGILGGGLLAANPGQAGKANELGNPFDTSGSSWMSLEHYTDKTTRFPETEEAPEETENTGIEETPPEETAKTATAPQEPPPEEPKIAQPTRPINLPIMPGVNQGYGISVTSTQEEDLLEEEKMAQPTRPLNLPVMPGVNQSRETATANTAAEDEQTTEIDDKEWKNAQTAAKKASRKTVEEKQMPINVRLATMPDNKTKAMPGAPIIRPHKKAEEKTAEKQAPKPKTPQAEKKNPEACAALTAYRKKQLEAIESDRKTLSALQAAIAELGLNKELDFLTGASKQLSTPAKTDKNPQTTETSPATSPVATKKEH